MVGNAHIDPVYMWRWQEGFQEIRATFRSALDRMKEYPEFIFSGSSAAFYEWIEGVDPRMFEEIRARVAEGRWVIVGGWWIQPDCNIPSGESLARHGLYAQRYFRDHLGVMATVGYNPDSFGHPATLPQLLLLSGIGSYVFMRPEVKDRPDVPRGAFRWTGIDGSQVVAWRILSVSGYGSRGYGGRENTLMEKGFEESRELIENGLPCSMILFGVSNHGGGPTISQLDRIRQLQSDSAVPRPVFSSPDRFFRDLADSGAELPEWRDDLRESAGGCYSAFAPVKLFNQHAEHLLFTTEKMSCLAACHLALPYPNDVLARSWKDVLFNQFHDILGGTSIKDAYVDVRDHQGRARRDAAEVLNTALQRLAGSMDTRGPGVPLVVFNSHPWRLRVPVELELDVCDKPEEWGFKLLEESGREVAHQLKRTGSVFWPGIRLGASFIADLPALGWRTYWIAATGAEAGSRVTNTERSPRYAALDWHTRKSPQPQAVEPAVCDGPRASLEQFPQSFGVRALSVENECIRLEFDRHTGALRSLRDMRMNVEFLEGSGIIPLVMHDGSDTWSFRHNRYSEVTGRFGDASFSMLDQGPVRAAVRVKQTCNRSTVVQDFILYKDQPHVEVHVSVHWGEKLKALKLSVPTTVRGALRVEEPYGSIPRPMDGCEQPFQRWIDVSGTAGGKECGLGLVCEGKHGFDAREGEIRPTILRSPVFCCMTEDLDPAGSYDYTDQGEQSFAYLIVPHPGGWQAAGYHELADRLLAPPITLTEGIHEGPLPCASEGFVVEGSGVGLAAWKQAEDGDDWIVRCAEQAGKCSNALLRIPALGREIPLAMKPFQIVTLRVPQNAGEPVKRVNLIEDPIMEQERISHED